MKIARVKFTSNCMLVSDCRSEMCEFGAAAILGGCYTQCKRLQNTTTRDADWRTEMTTRCTGAVDSYLQADSKATATEWVHNGSANLVFVDGHCETKNGNTGLTPTEFVPY